MINVLSGKQGWLTKQGGFRKNWLKRYFRLEGSLSQIEICSSRPLPRLWLLIAEDAVGCTFRYFKDEHFAEVRAIRMSACSLLLALFIMFSCVPPM